MSRALRPRALLALLGAGAVLATTVLTTSSSAATAQSSITVPSTVGKKSVSWTGTVPFGNGQTGLVWGQLGIDDPTGACEPSHPELNAQRTVKVTFPKGGCTGVNGTLPLTAPCSAVIAVAVLAASANSAIVRN